jgi:hypothetical protein
VYSADTYDGDGAAIGWSIDARPDAEGRACVTGLGASSSRDGYTIVRLRTQRGHTALPRILVHLATDPDNGSLRIIGLRRE